jgi:thioredoxin-like negative regulator of GroEL
MKSKLKELAMSRPRLIVNFVDIDESPEIKQKYAIEDVPTIIVLDDADNVVEKFQGATALDRLLKSIEE